jgi:hypothetical protein
LKKRGLFIYILFLDKNVYKRISNLKQMQDKQNYSEFIDADAGFSNEKNSYEELILRQMSKCAEVLSREMTGGQVVYKQGVTGSEKYIEDVRELVINHVDTLKMLMTTYITGDNLKQYKIICKEIEETKKEILKTKTIIPGRGEVELKDIKGVNVNNPIWKEYIHFKALKHREMFEILVNAYNQEKANIRALESE